MELSIPTLKTRISVWRSIESQKTFLNFFFSLKKKKIERSFLKDIPKLLSSNVSVVMYNGDQDLICNFYGTGAYLNQMTWPGQQGFVKASNHSYVVGGQSAGSIRTYGGLTFVVVYQAGHSKKNKKNLSALLFYVTFCSFYTSMISGSLWPTCCCFGFDQQSHFQHPMGWKKAVLNT